MHESYIRYSAEEKETIVLSVKRSGLSIVQACTLSNNCKCSYLCCNIILLCSEILLLIIKQ